MPTSYTTSWDLTHASDTAETRITGGAAKRTVDRGLGQMTNLLGRGVPLTRLLAPRE